MIITSEREQIRLAVLNGFWFQLIMISVLVFRAAYGLEFDLRRMVMYGFEWKWSSLVLNAGFFIMLVAMLRIYRWPPRTTLITTDIFALTRHPMYHGMVIADAAIFFEANLRDPIIWITWPLFIVLICTAGWFQEKETLARWRGEALIYYETTPRFVFEWLWRRWY